MKSPDVERRYAEGTLREAVLRRVLHIRSEDADRQAKNGHDPDAMYAHVRALEKRIDRLERKAA